MASRMASLVYGILVYVIFLGSFIYAVAFVGDFEVPRTINSGPRAGSMGWALGINALLLGLFAVQHSVMARGWFKNWWTKIIPAQIERSTYVLLSSLLLILLFWQWRPLPQPVWIVETAPWNGVLDGLFWLGWIIVLASTFMINHFSLFGLRQVYHFYKGEEADPVPFQKPGLYRYVRHPLMLGFLIAFWATPRMTLGHLVFAIATTAYIFLGTWLEERDLIRHYGDRYREYRRQAGMVIPLPKRDNEH